MAGNLKAIETEYKGHRFRSRLEARWAVFFDTLGVLWEYEREGYDLNGRYYLPDFWLPAVTLRSDPKPGIWGEIKGQKHTQEEALACELLCKATRRPVILFEGLPRGIFQWNETDASDSGYQFYQVGNSDSDEGFWWDNCMFFIQCHDERCRHIKVEFAEGSYMECPICGAKANDESSRLLEAYAAARAARFEHRKAANERKGISATGWWSNPDMPYLRAAIEYADSLPEQAEQVPDANVEPAAEDAPFQPSPELQRLCAIWPQILDSMGAAGVVYRASRPLRMDGSVLLLGFKKVALRPTAEKSSVLACLQSALSRAWGSNVAVQFRYGIKEVG